MNRLQKYPRLLPHRFKKIGLLIALSGIAYIIAILFLKFVFELNTTESKYFHLNLTAILMLVGLGIRSMSKEKNEDEFILQIRLRSLSGMFMGGAGFAFVAAIFSMAGAPESVNWSIQAFVVWELWMYQLLFWENKRQYFKENS